ncbi:hypothetical protein [Streptomyces iranensis]|uniref:hypothetical protein n=1 Tax=Streptomyces iranensis TaxID=576784 RepID=UPI0039B737FA
MGAYVSEGALSRAAYESRLDGASKSQIVRFSLLRLIMPADEARTAVFGELSDLKETRGRVDASLPVHEMNLIRRHYPGIPVSDLVRLGLAVASGVPEEQARVIARVKRGRPKNRS